MLNINIAIALVNQAMKILGSSWGQSRTRRGDNQLLLHWHEGIRKRKYPKKRNTAIKKAMSRLYGPCAWSKEDYEKADWASQRVKYHAFRFILEKRGQYLEHLAILVINQCEQQVLCMFYIPIFFLIPDIFPSCFVNCIVIIKNSDEGWNETLNMYQVSSE